jgi:hypothetical protein
VLPDLQTMPPTDLVIWIDAQGRKTLRFSNWILNAGPGVLEIWGESNPETEKTSVTQRLYKTDGSYDERPTGDFVFHPTHNHWHTENFALYEVWSVKTGGQPDKVVAVTDKVSYCLRDDRRSALEGATRQGAYFQCNQDKQGMSPGWIDIYSFDTPGQIVDITDVSNGIYMLRSTVDPGNQLVESNNDNNAATVYLEITGNRVRTLNRQTALDRLRAPTPTAAPTATRSP